jgi:hypothetical protein
MTSEKEFVCLTILIIVIISLLCNCSNSEYFQNPAIEVFNPDRQNFQFFSGMPDDKIYPLIRRSENLLG